jgi:hypothetical protein
MYLWINYGYKGIHKMQTTVRIIQVLILSTLISVVGIGQKRCYDYDAAGCRIIRDLSCDPSCSIIVTNINDAGIGSLRKAIECARDGDTIQFAPAVIGQVINITSGPILINKSINILQDISTVVQVGGSVRSFQINNGTTTLNHIKLYAECHPWFQGTAIRNYGHLVMDTVTIVQQDNVACIGASVNNFGTMAIIGDTKIIKQ